MHGLQPWGEVQWKESHTLNPSPSPKEKAKIVFWRYLSYTICICQAPAMPLPRQPWGWHVVVASLMTSFSGWWRWAAGQHAFFAVSAYIKVRMAYILCACARAGKPLTKWMFLVHTQNRFLESTQGLSKSLFMIFFFWAITCLSPAEGSESESGTPEVQEQRGVLFQAGQIGPALFSFVVLIWQTSFTSFPQSVSRL